MTAIDRRHFLGASAASLGALGLLRAVPGWARGATGGTLARRGSDVLSGEHLTMTVADATFATGARRGPAVTVNGTLPGPLLRLKEGQDLIVDLVNNSSDETSIHWHGMLVPFLMDGVPGVTMPAVKPGETYRYRFPIRQAGTYWWHAHTLQEPMGHYGPIVIDPAAPDQWTYDREYVLMLSDWSPIHPHEIMRKLKVGDAYFNRQKTTMTDDYPLSAADRRMWARMRMSPTDISDVTGSTYTFLINGHGPDDGLELAYNAGERIRLRIINAAAMTFFNVRIPGLPMTVVAADGQNVSPVEVDEFQVGNAETYDVIIEPKGAEAFAFVAEAIDRSGMGIAMLSARVGARAEIPPLRDPPLLTMADMGMGPDVTSIGGMSMRDTSMLPPQVTAGPGLDTVAMAPADRMGEPGTGLAQVDHRVLTYRQLVAAKPGEDHRTPSRLQEIHLTESDLQRRRSQGKGAEAGARAVRTGLNMKPSRRPCQLRDLRRTAQTSEARALTSAARPNSSWGSMGCDSFPDSNNQIGSL